MKIVLSSKKYLIWFFVLLSGCIFLGYGCSRGGDAESSLKSESSIEAAQSAWMRMDLKESRGNLEGVWADSGTGVDDRADAARMLAIQDWKFFRDYAAASDRIKQADTLGVKRSSTWQAMSRIARGNGSFSAARDAAAKAVETARSTSDNRESKILLAHAIHDQAMNMLALGEKPGRDSLDEAHSLLMTVLSEEPGHPVASKLLFGISMMRRDGPTALKAWRYFFLVPENGTGTGLLVSPWQELNRILPNWQGQDLSVPDKVSLLLAAAGSRFYEYAAILSDDLEACSGYSVENNPAVNEVVLYGEFIKKIKEMTDEYYRRIAIDDSEIERSSLEKAYMESLWREAENFWNLLPFSGERPEYDQQLFKAEISKRFGTEFSPGSSGNYNGLVLFMGHRIMDDPIEVEQYGRKAENLRFIVLESMVSNGYSGWFWDGMAAPGGWSTESAIVWIREVYLPTLFSAWRGVTDPRAMAKTEKEMARETALDDDRARKNPYAYLPGLQRRLKFDADKRFYADMKAKGYEGTELCIAFEAEYLRLKLESTIYAHEGRHSIDQIFYADEFENWTDEREFRAKLSQIVFTSNPRLAIASGGIIHQNISESSQHGRANKRIMETIVRWMDKHTAEIEEVDMSRPMLPQFDLLSDDQIKAVFMEADPMAVDAFDS